MIAMNSVDRQLSVDDHLGPIQVICGGGCGAGGT